MCTGSRQQVSTFLFQMYFPCIVCLQWFGKGKTKRFINIERRAYLGVHLHELDFGNFDGVVVLVFLFFFFLGRFDFFHDEFERIVVERQLS